MLVLLQISSLPDINHEQLQLKQFSSLKEEGEKEQSPGDPFEQTNSPNRLDFRKILDQNKELTRRNQKLSNTLDALRKERELLVWERDRLKQEKKESFTKFTRRIASLSDEPGSVGSKGESEQRVSVLQQELANRDKEIASLREKIKDKETNTTTQEVDIKILREGEPEETVGSAKYKSILDKLVEEQAISSKLRASNSELQLRLANMEAEMEKLHLQNSHNLLLVEQVTAAAQASTLAVPTVKPKKKNSIFGMRRSGRKKNGGEASKAPPTSGVNLLSTSQPSLEASLSEHDLNTNVTRKSEATLSTGVLPYNPFNKSSDTQLLQTSVKLAMEEKSEVERQLACLREELNAYHSRLEELVQENEKKEILYVDAVQELSSTRQALQLATKERELLTSENEGLCLEIESVRAEKDALRGKEVKAVLKEKQEMEFLRSENKALMSEIRVLIKNSDGLETSLSQLKREQVAKDVRDHEMKLKVKRVESENERLQLELKRLQAEKNVSEDKKTPDPEKVSEDRLLKSAENLNSPKRVSFSKKSESPSREDHSPSTGQHQLRPADRKHLGQPIFSKEKSPPKSLVYHERAQSEDLSAQQALSTKHGAGVPMHRSSSGGTKAVAIQATLPIKETPLKVSDKSSSVPSLSPERVGADGKKLGTFHPSSPRSFAAVNSLVKMFESGQAKTQDMENGEKRTEMSQSELPTDMEQKSIETIQKASLSLSESGTSSLSSSHSPSRETTPGRHSSSTTKERSPSRERRTSASSQRRLSQSKKDRSPDVKGSTKDSESKESSTSKLSSQSTRNISGTTAYMGNDKDDSPKDSMKNSKQTSSSSLKEAPSDSKSPSQTEANAPSKEKKQFSSSTRKFSHGSSEAKYLMKKEEERVKDQSHRRTASLVISNEVSNQLMKDNGGLVSNKAAERKEVSSRKQFGNAKETSTSAKPVQSTDQSPSETSKEKLTTISEKSIDQEDSARKGIRSAVSKHISRFSITVPDDETSTTNASRKTDQADRLPTAVEKSQTWPIKTTHDSAKDETANNTLPTTGKGGAASSPNQLKPLAISKPKPPPTANAKSTSTTTNPTTNVTSPLSSSSGEYKQAGFVSSLRSSWEKKSNTAPLKPLCKTSSTNTVSYIQERSGSFNSPSSPNKPITKSGSGPPGVILYSPSKKTSSPPPPLSSTATQPFQSAPLSPTSKVFKPFHPPLMKTGSSPLMTQATTPSTTTTTGSVAHHNGIPSISYSKSSVSKRISSFEPLIADGGVEDKSNPTTNGTSVSPRLSRRPASLYVSSTNAQNSEKKLSSLITILQEKSQGPSSSPPPPQETKFPLSKKIDRYAYI